MKIVKRSGIVKPALVLVLVLVMLTGCGQRLDKDEYSQRLKDGFKSWTGCVTHIAVELFTDESADYDKLSGDIKTAREALDSIYVLEPPEDFDGHHSKLRENIDIERKWLDSAGKALSAKKNGDSAAFDAARSECELYGNTSKFPSEFLDVIKELK